jgi:hypothetical protein
MAASPQMDALSFKEEIRRPTGVSDWKVLFLLLFLACTCSFELATERTETRTTPSNQTRLLYQVVRISRKRI